MLQSLVVLVLFLLIYHRWVDHTTIIAFVELLHEEHGSALLLGWEFQITVGHGALSRPGLGPLLFVTEAPRHGKVLEAQVTHIEWILLHVLKRFVIVLHINLQVKLLYVAESNDLIPYQLVQVDLCLDLGSELVWVPVCNTILHSCILPELKRTLPMIDYPKRIGGAHIQR